MDQEWPNTVKEKERKRKRNEGNSLMKGEKKLGGEKKEKECMSYNLV